MQHCFPFCFFRFLSVIKLFSVLTDDAAARANPPPALKKRRVTIPNVPSSLFVLQFII